MESLLTELVVALVVQSQAASRRNFIERAEVATENLAATLAQSIESDLDSVDIGLRNVALDLEADFSAGAPDAARVEALLDQQLALLPQLESIRIADAQGLVRHGRGVAAAPRTVIDDRGYFVRARDGRQAGAIVDGPLQARISRKWVAVVARALRDARGAFLTTEHITKAQAIAKFREAYRTATKEELARLATWLINRVQAGDITAAQIKTAFGLTDPQYLALRDRAIALRDHWLAVQAAVGE